VLDITNYCPDDNIKVKKLKVSTGNSLSASLFEVAKSLAAPVQISQNKTCLPSLEDQAKIQELDVSEKMADT